jgi:hypothetical protein
MFRSLPETIKNTENYERKVREIKRRTFLKWKKIVKRRYLRNTCLHPNMSDCIAPTLINWLIENLESAQDTEYVDLTEINKKYKAKASGLSLGNSLKIIFSNVKVEQDCAKHDWTKRTKRYYGITWKCQRNSHIAFGDISSVIPDDLFVLSKLTDSIIIGYVTGDIVNGSKVLQEIILNSNTSWKVLIRGKTVNPGKIGLDELYNLDSVFEIVRQMQYCRAVPEVVKSKENLAYLKDFISKVGYENSSEVCFG